MLLSNTTLVYYGPAAGAVVAGGGAAAGLAIQGTARAGLVDGGSGAGLRLKATRLRNSPLVVGGAGTLAKAAPKLRATPALRVRIGTLSQDDVTGAVLEARVEDGVTLKQALRLLLAYAAGDASGLDGNPVFKSLDGTKTRLAGTLVGGARTITTRDGT